MRALCTKVTFPLDESLHTNIIWCCGELASASVCYLYRLKNKLLSLDRVTKHAWIILLLMETILFSDILGDFYFLSRVSLQSE